MEPGNVPIRILVAGLTAAGKSTQCRLLAAHYGIPFVPMRSVMAALLRERRLPGSDAQAWTPAVDEARVLAPEIDLEADRRMLERARLGPGVFDAWALPWLLPDPSAVRVWIEADLPSRVQRCRQSAIARGLPVPDDPFGLLREKDEFSRERFRELYGIDLRPSPEVFDVIAENSRVLPEHSSALFAADAGRFNVSLIEEIETARHGKEGTELTRARRVPP